MGNTNAEKMFSEDHFNHIDFQNMVSETRKFILTTILGISQRKPCGDQECSPEKKMVIWATQMLKKCSAITIYPHGETKCSPYFRDLKKMVSETRKSILRTIQAISQRKPMCSR